MARRSDHTREELKELALTEAAKTARRRGWRAVTARGVARAIGYTPGTLYNVFKNLDDLLLQMNGRTLDALYAHVTQAPVSDAPAEALRQLGTRYAAFVAKHPRLWAAVMEFEPKRGSELPAWYRARAVRLVGLGERAIAGYFADGQEEERQRSAYVLWSALYGITARNQSTRFTPDDDTAHLLDNFITTYIAGLDRLRRAGRGRTKPKGRAKGA